MTRSQAIELICSLCKGPMTVIGIGKLLIVCDLSSNRVYSYNGKELVIRGE